MRQRLHDLRSQKGDEGFTLVELLIVIVVLGILAGIVVFGVSTFRDDATTAACKADVKTVQVAVDAYHAAEGNLPADVDALVTEKYLRSKPAGVTITGGVADSAAC